jgi:glycogen operon protein
MLTAGDELGRTQQGNNNAYAQDNAITWIDWEKADLGLAAFVGRLGALRRQHRSLSDDNFLTGKAIDATGIQDVMWLKLDGTEMRDGEWATLRCLGVAFYVPPSGQVAADRVLVWINGTSEPVAAALPKARAGFAWTRELDSAVVETKDARAIDPRSVTVFAETPT